MMILGVDLASGPGGTVEQRVFVSPPCLYEHAVEYFKDTDVIVIKNEPLSEGIEDYP